MRGSPFTPRHALALVLGVALGLSAFAGAAEPPPRVPLCAGGLDAWRGNTGDWVHVGDVLLDPNDEKLLISKPGTGTFLNGPTGRTKHLFSKAEFGDCRAHIEFMVPKGSNSGVYFQGRYEVQVL
ncbi:MAG: DUF1080 domain-containing protein, partial [bacterium]|nr:DUF1080 domain-containing protein [bacterium]